MEEILKITVVLLYAVFINGKPVYKAGHFPYSKCSQTINSVLCEKLNITKVHYEDEASLWPPGPYAIPVLPNRRCPESVSKGWKKGVIKSASNGTEFTLMFCFKSRHHPKLEQERWIPGRYHIYKAGNTCPSGFTEINRTWSSTDMIRTVTHMGSVPAYEVYNKSGEVNITFFMCERNSTDVDVDKCTTEFGMLQTEFLLGMKENVTCQQFSGTFAREVSLDSDTEVAYCFYMPDKKYVDGTDGYNWIGARYDSSYKEHRWLDGSVIIGNGWGPEKPGSIKGCVNYAQHINHMWSSHQDCDFTSSPFICEKALGCEKGWESFKGGCYLFVDYRKSWEDAKNLCEKSGAKLLVVEDETEQEYINERFKNYSAISFWIGACCKPFNMACSMKECIEYVKVYGIWYCNYQCGYKSRFVCEKGCGRGWEIFGKSCYYFSSIERSWHGAKSFCEREEANLAIVDDEKENTYIRQKLSADRNERFLQLMSDFSMTTGDVSDDTTTENYTWYQLDFGRTLSLAKIEILTNIFMETDNYESDFITYKKSLLRNIFINCFYDDVRWSFMYLEANACGEEVTFDNSIFSLHMRHVRGRFITLIFDETSGNQMITSKQSITIFLSSIPDSDMCNEDLGLTDGTIKDRDISASSWLPGHTPSAGRPFGAGWCPEKTDSRPWIMVDLKVEVVVEGLSIWSLETHHELTNKAASGCSSMYIYYGGKADSIAVYKDMVLVIDFSRSETEAQSFLFLNTIKARYIKLELSPCPSKEVRCLRFELQGCKLSDTRELFPTLVYPEGDFIANVEYVEVETIISSIGYPFVGSGQDYKWIIQSPERRFVRITFTNVSLGYLNEDCYDRILISKATKAETTGIEIDVRFSKRDFVIETSESLVYLTVVSCLASRGSAEGGFRALVTEQDTPACFSIDSGMFWSDGRKEVCNKPNMLLTSMSILNLPYEDLEELWEIHGGKHQSLQLDIMDFYVVCPSVAGEITSKFTVIEFTQERIFCNTDRPPDVIYSQTSNIMVKFRNYKAPRKTVTRMEGFRLQYSTINHSLEQLTHIKGSKGCSPMFGKCYSIIPSRSNWYDANLECWSRGEELVSVHSQYEMLYINYLLRDRSYQDGFDRQLSTLDSSFGHIGLKRGEHGGQGAFFWTDASPITYSAWTPGNPSDIGDCTRTNFQMFVDETWETQDCINDRAKYCVCQSKIGDEQNDTKGIVKYNCESLVMKNDIKVKITYSGKTCQNWNNLDRKARGDFRRRFPLLGIPTEADNTCQDPASGGLLWCYPAESEDYLWEPCFTYREEKHYVTDQNITGSLFRCDDNRQVPGVYRCDGTFHCRDFSDEVSCENSVKWHFLFNNSQRNSSKVNPRRLDTGQFLLCGSDEWIHILAKCDGVIDCLDASDEINCTKPKEGCADYEFTCNDGSCVHNSQVCDSYSDCADAEDEFCVDCEDSFHCDGVKCIPHQRVCDDVQDCEDGSDEEKCISSCDDWLELGYRISGQYIIGDMNVFCDFSEVTGSGGKIKITFRNIGVNIDTNKLYTGSSQDKFLQLKNPRVLKIISSSECFLQVQTTCSFSSLASVVLRQYYSDVGTGCECSTDIFKVIYNGTRAKQKRQPLRWPETSANVTELLFLPFQSERCGERYDNQSVGKVANDYNYYNVVSSDAFYIDDRVLRRTVPIYITVGPLSCYYDYRARTKDPIIACDGENRMIPAAMRCIYDLESPGVLKGCRLGSHLKNCDNFTCPQNTVKCPDSFCIPIKFVCDGSNECPGGEDERGCTCTKSAREVVILVDDKTETRESYTAAVNLAKQFYQTGSNIRLLHFKSKTLQEFKQFVAEGVILEITENAFNPFVAFGFKKCSYKSVASNFLRNIQFAADNLRAVIFIEDSSESSHIADLIWHTLSSEPGFLSYRVSKNIKFDLNSHVNDSYQIVRNVAVNRWSELFSIGYRKFPEICEAATEVPCIGGYRCSSSKQCIPVEQICDGIPQCIGRDDERLCSSFCPGRCTCTGYTINCRGANLEQIDVEKMSRELRIAELSINPSLKNVLMSDPLRFPLMIQLNLSFCEIENIGEFAFSLLNKLRRLDIGNNRIKQLPDNVFANLNLLEYLNMDGNFELSEISSSAFNGLKSLKNLHITKTKLRKIPSFTFSYMIIKTINISYNEIEEMEDFAFLFLNNLTSLDIGYNRIRHISGNVFSNLSQLWYLGLDGNFELSEISPTAFHGLKSLRYLRITETKLRRISSHTFSYLTLEFINISYNEIEEIEDFAFSNISVEKIDFSGNNIKILNKHIFSQVTALRELRAPAFSFCCIRPCYLDEDDCYPAKNEFSSCEDLMRHPVLQAILWLVGIAALLGNFGSIIYRLAYDRQRLKIGYGIFVTNLAAADFLMGIYLIMIAVVDSIYRKRYIFMDEQWRNSKWCVTAGVLSTVSSEASVLFLCLITLDRLLVIKYPFGQVRFEPKKAHISCLVSWVIAFALALIPVVYTGYFQDKFYSRSGVCVALPLTRDKPPGWMYSVTIFVGLNFCTFILVAFGQLSIFLELRRATRGMKKTQKSRKRDLQVARNLILVATTDFMCWFPVGVMGIMALNGYAIPGDVYAWTAVFILPLNSALNPVLYTLSAIIGKRSFNPSTEEQERTELQKEIGTGILKHQDLIESVRIKRDVASIGKSLHDLLKENGHISTPDVIAIGMQLAKYMCLLHEASICINKLSETTTYINIDPKKKQRVSIVLDTKISLAKDEKVIQDNIYQFGVLLRRLIAKRK